MYGAEKGFDAAFDVDVAAAEIARLEREARRLDAQRVMTCLRDLPAVAARYGDGLIGTDQVRRIAAVWAPRVREYLSVCEAEFLLAAREKLTRPDGTPVPDHLTHWPVPD